MGLYWTTASERGVRERRRWGGVRRLVRHRVSVGCGVARTDRVFNQYFMQHVAGKWEKLRVGQPPHSSQN